MDEDGNPVVVLAKKSAFTVAEEIAVQSHLAKSELLIAQYLPSDHEDNPFSQLIASNDPYAFAKQYAYNVAPVTDNAPFFFFTLKLGQVLHPGYKHAAMDWKVNLGVAVLLMVLAISLLAVLAFLVIPLAVHGHRRNQPMLPLFYFVVIGVGYIIVEITFIQRFVLFLGHPTYALSVVVFLLLLSSGAGSLISRRWLPDSRKVWRPLLMVIGFLLLYVAILPQMLSALVGITFLAKLAVSALLLAPLGFIMGMPFPTGLRALSNSASETPDGSVEWAWALNAGASVLGSVTAILIAIQFGLNATLICGVASYGLALLLASTLHSPRFVGTAA